MTSPKESSHAASAVQEALRRQYVTRFSEIVSSIISNPDAGYGGYNSESVVNRAGLLRLTNGISLEYIQFRPGSAQEIIRERNLSINLPEERNELPSNALVIRDIGRHSRTTFAAYENGSVVRTHVVGLINPESVSFPNNRLEFSRELDQEEVDAFLQFAESPAVHWRERFVASRLTQSESELLAESMAPDFEAQQEDIRRRRAALENRAE